MSNRVSYRELRFIMTESLYGQFRKECSAWLILLLLLLADGTVHNSVARHLIGHYRWEDQDFSGTSFSSISLPAIYIRNGMTF